MAMPWYLKWKYFAIYIAVWLIILSLGAIFLATIIEMKKDSAISEKHFNIFSTMILCVGVMSFVYPAWWVYKRRKFKKQQQLNSWNYVYK